MASLKKIKLKLLGCEGVRYEGCPLTFGVPFADGDLERGAPVRVVDEDGKVLPTQTECLSTWHRDLKYVKWLLVDIQADLDGEAGGLFLEYGNVEPAPQPEQPVRVEERGGYLNVDTGVLTFSLRTAFDAWRQPRNPDVFASCRVQGQDGWLDVFRGKPGPFLYMMDQHGNDYDSCTAGPAPKVVVEEAGPLRTCVRIQGYHAMAQGQRFCPYTLRIHFFAGKREVRICHTFVYDQEPHDVELAAVGMMFPLDLGGDLRAAVGGADATHWAENWEEMAFLQSDDLNYTVVRDGEHFAGGEKGGGWASLSGNRGGVAVVVKDCWQEYPKGFVLNPDGIDVQIWPASCGETLTFTTPFEEPALSFTGSDGKPIRGEGEIVRLLAEHPTAPLNLKSFNVQSVEDAAWVEEIIEKYAADRVMTYNDTATNNGVGAAKTTEIHLRFSAFPIGDDEAEALALTVQEPPVASAEPEYICGTGAFEHYCPAGDDRFVTADADLDDLHHMVAVAPIALCRPYGMMRHGDMVCSHSSAPGFVYLYYKDREPEKALRYVGPYHNEANDQILCVWGNWVRSGRREDRLLAQGYSRAVADVAIVHAHPVRPDDVGIIHYHNGHPWSGSLSRSHTVVGGILADYYFTGNRRLLEVALEVANRIVRTQEPAGILSCRGGTLHRDFTGPLSVLMEVYQATWEMMYGKLAERSLNWLLRTLPEAGKYPNGVFTRGERGDEGVVSLPCLPEVSWGNKYHMYAIASRLFDSKRLRELLVKEADYFMWEAPGNLLNYACTTVCFAYDLTGDFCYAAYCKQVVEENFHRFVERYRNAEAMSFESLAFSGYIPRLMRTVADAMDRDPEAFARAEAEWRQKRQAMPDRPDSPRPDRGPEINLGVLSTEPHPAP